MAENSRTGSKMNEELDGIDLKILDALQADGRLTITELGERVGLSTSPCSQRVKRLERLGVIAGYHAKLNAEAVGRPLLVFVEITLSEKSEQIFKKVRDELQHMPEVLECHLISGSFDYLVKARLKGMSEYRQLLGTMLKRIPVPAQSNSYVVMEEIKETFAIRLARQAPKA
jgi:Lrp/AsnC family leucine-responsive transcriptional regulator